MINKKIILKGEGSVEEMFKKALEIPSLANFKNVLVVGPHPDDIEIGAGGFVSRLIKKGYKVTYLICTDGGSGTRDYHVKITDLIKIRKEESLAAAKLMGVAEVYFLDYPDGGIYDTARMSSDISRIIITVKPDLVLCPDPNLSNETHPDHLNVGEATRRSLVAAMYPNSARRHGLEIDESTVLPQGITLGYYYTDRANTVIDLTDEDFMKQVAALKCHQSQMDSSMEMVTGYLKMRGQKLGSTINAPHGEGYFVLAPIHQHCFLEKLS